MKKLSEIRVYIEQLLNEYNENGSFYTSELADEDKTFTVVETWRPWEEFITKIIKFAELYYLYEEAVSFSDKKDVSQYGDLRLGRNNLFPGDDRPDASESERRYGSTPYLVPDAMQPIEELIDELVGEWGFSDEWGRCDNCGKVLRTSPDSYGWTPDYVTTNYGEDICKNCTSVSETLEEYVCQRKSLPWFVQSKAIKDGDIVKMDPKWENGFHHGMNDDPKAIAKALRNMGVTQWWWDVSPSQFYVDFKLLLRKEDLEILEKLWKPDMGETHIEEDDEGRAEERREAKANMVLKNINAYQGYDTATEMSLALQGKPTPHVTVITTTFANGIPTTTANNDVKEVK